MIWLPPDAWIAARAVEALRIAKVDDRIEVQVWFGAGGKLVAADFDPYDGNTRQQANDLMSELAAKVDHELSSQHG